MIYLFLFLIFIFPISTSASSAYIKEFSVLNGSLSLNFNEQNNIYTIYLEEDATKVEYTIELEDEESKLEVTGDTYKENQENVMIIKVESQDDTELQTYTFYLEKELDQTASQEYNSLTALNIPKKERSAYLAPTVILCCTSLILFLFYLLIIRYMRKIKRKRTHHLHRIK